MYERQDNVYHLEYRPHQPVTIKRRLVWKPVNAVQAWLEGRDKPPAKVFAYGVLAVTAVFLVVQVMLKSGISWTN